MLARQVHNLEVVGANPTARITRPDVPVWRRAAGRMEYDVLEPSTLLRT